MDRIISLSQGLSRHRRAFVFILLASVILPAVFLPRLSIDNSIEVWLDRDSKAYGDYREFQQRFGNEEFVVIAAEMSDPLSELSLKKQGDLAEKIRPLKDVEQVLALPEIYGIFYGQKHVPVEQVRKNPLLRNLLLGQDGNTVGIIIWLKPLEGAQTRQEVISQIQYLVQNHFDKTIPFHLAGTPVLNVALDAHSQQAAQRFLPIAIVISIVVLFLTLRSASGVIACMVSVVATVIWTMGIMAWQGQTLNMVTVVLPSLLFVLALSNAIHLSSRYLHWYGQGKNPTEAFALTLQELFRPAFMASLTTAIGFASLIISDMVPVTNFGLYAALGMMLSLPCNLILVPGLLSLINHKVSCRGNSISYWLERFSTFPPRYPRCLLAGAIVIAIGCFVLLKFIRVESNVVNFFPENSTISKDCRFVAERLTGLYSVELEIEAHSSLEAKVLSNLNSMAAVLAVRPEVARVNHLGQLYQALPVVGISSLQKRDDAPMAKMAEYMIKKYRVQQNDKIFLRASVLVRAMDSHDFYKLIDFIQAEAKKIFPAENIIRITGVVPLLNDAQRNLIQTQIECFSFAFGIVLVFIGILLRSWRALLASILPNLLPVLIVFGLMPIFHIPLDPATVMIASVAIGLAVDNTIHFLVRFQQEKRKGEANSEVFREMYGQYGRAMIFTSVVAASGFSILMLAPFRPLSYFGFLMAVTVITALITDFVLTPLCIMLFNFGVPLPKNGNENKSTIA